MLPSVVVSRIGQKPLAPMTRCAGADLVMPPVRICAPHVQPRGKLGLEVVVMLVLPAVVVSPITQSELRLLKAPRTIASPEEGGGEGGAVVPIFGTPPPLPKPEGWSQKRAPG